MNVIDKLIDIGAALTRNEARRLVQSGLVKINDQTATLDTIFTDNDTITVGKRKLDTEILNEKVEFVYDRDGLDKDLLEHYSQLALLVSLTQTDLTEDLKKGETYHIIIHKVSK